MTSNMDIAKAWVDANSLEATDAYLADDFQNVDSDGTVLMDKAGYLGMGHMMYDAFEGLRYVCTDLREEGDNVIMTGHFEGTHVADLDLSPLGAGVIPASGRSIVWPDSSAKLKIAGGKIVRLEELGEGGVEAFLAPLMG